MEKQLEELRTASKSLIDYLRKNHHPHVTAIVTSNSVEILEGLLNIPNVETTNSEVKAVDFEIGKYYRHTTGEEIAILGRLKTTKFGECLIAESNKSINFKAVGEEEGAAVNWKEITKEQWMKNFSV